MSKKDIKNILILLVILVVSSVAGFFAGRGMRVAQNNGFDMNAWFAAHGQTFAKAMPVVWLAVSAAAFLIVFLYISRIRMAMPQLNDAEDTDEAQENYENALYRLERKIFVPSILINIMMVVNMMFFPICLFLAERYGGAPVNTGKNGVLWLIVLFVVNYVWIITGTELCVRIEKKLNPEKRGSVLELNFEKKWVGSMDEAQKLILYRSGYKAFRAGNITCLILWIVTFIGMMAFHTGIFAPAAVCVIWLVMVTAYVVTDMKLEK